MKKIILSLVILISVNSLVYADGNAFTPLNFNDTSYQGNSVTKITSGSSATFDEATGNGNIQNAILQLDNAQVDIRNDLLNLKTKFADIDAQYKLIKSERKTLQNQINTIQKRIKEIDKAKEKIRKNML